MAATVISPLEVLSLTGVTLYSSFSVLTSSQFERLALTITALQPLALLLGWIEF